MGHHIVVVLTHPHIWFISALVVTQSPDSGDAPRYFWSQPAARSAVPPWCAAHLWSNLVDWLLQRVLPSGNLT